MKDRNVDVYLFGKGKESGRYRTIVDRYGLRDRVRFSDERHTKKMFFDAIDLLCVPSRNEGFGFAALEGIWNGIPVAAARVGGIPEVLEPPVECEFFPPGRVDGLAEALERVIRDPERLRQAAEENARIARVRFSVRGMANATLRVYEEALRVRRPSGGGSYFGGTAS